MAGIPAGTQHAGSAAVDELKAAEARLTAAQTSGTIPGSPAQRSADAVQQARWWSRPASRRRWPGLGWSVKAGQRKAAKRRNVLRNRRAHR